MVLQVLPGVVVRSGSGVVTGGVAGAAGSQPYLGARTTGDGPDPVT